MPIVGADKQKIDAKDVQALKDMLRQSIGAHITYLNEKYEQYTSNNVKRSKQILLTAFQDAFDGVNASVDKANGRGSSNVRPEEFIDNFFSNLLDNITQEIDKAQNSEKDEEKLKRWEFSHIRSFITEFGTAKAKEFANKKVRVEDTDDGYNLSESTFKLASKPIKGIEKIDNYNPNTGRIQILYDARSGNSGTLEDADVEKRKEELDKIPETDPEGRKVAQHKLQEALSSTTGLHAGGEMARIYSSELMNNKNVTFADIYNVFIGLNKTVRIGDKEGGTFRAEGISAGRGESRIEGVGSFTAPKAVFKTMSKVADCMNIIKKTKNPALRKTRAIQLASYAYTMTVSEHVFMDGNGRTCRLFADTILQTFGLPPHTPLEGLKYVSKTIGTGAFNFDKGTEVLFEGIKLSNEALQKEKASNALKDNEKDKLSFKNREDSIDNSRILKLEDSIHNSGIIKLDISKDNVIYNNINDNFISTNYINNDIINTNNINNDIFNNNVSGFKREDKLSFENLEDNKISISNGKHLKVSEKLRYTGDPKAPNLEDIKQLEWVKKLGEKAEKSKGILSDSQAYLKFLENAKIISDLAEQISKRKGLDMGDGAIIPTSNFAKDTKKLTGENGFITVGEAKALYVETWGNLVKSAKAYEKYKLKDEGFTRDVKNKDKHQLKSRSKMKFELMDEIWVIKV